jgi:type 2 lantibiotic biosynthesis protein LanM
VASSTLSPPLSPAPDAADALAVLRDTVRRARPLHERMDAYLAHPWPAPAAPDPGAARRLDAWRAAAVNGDAAAFALRLSWDGLDEASALAMLSDEHAPDPADAELPAWARALDEAYGLTEPRAEPAVECAPADRVLDAADPLPFEPVFLPLVRWGREQVRRAAGDAYALLADDAHAALERSLLRRVTGTGAQALLTRLGVKRSLRSMGLAGTFAGGMYGEIVDEFRRGEMVRFAGQFPVAARLLGTAATLWVEAVSEFLLRLRADAADIQATLAGGLPVGPVASLTCDASDFHCGGRSVFLLTFASGARAVYKPRPLALEPAFAEVAAWLAAHPGAPALHSPALVQRPGYGWIEFVAGAPCHDRAAVDRYYQRCGALLAVAYALGGTDFHYENLLGAGEHPVLIDLETLLSHRFDLVEKVPAQGFGAEGVRSALQTSVVGVQMLPRLKVSAAGQAANAGALGGEAPPAGPMQVMVNGWVGCNTDEMKTGAVKSTIPACGGNLALLDGRRVPAGEHVDAVADGFARTYRLLAAHRAELLAADGAVSRLRGRPVRFILHHTSLYATLLERCLHPTHLVDGVARGIQLDALSRPLVSLGRKPAVWGALRAEHHDLERMDVPLFAPLSDSTALPLVTGGQAEGCFVRDAWSEAVRRLGSLNEADLSRQVEVIYATFRADAARELAVVTAPRSAGPEVEGTLPELALAEARAIAAGLRGSFIGPDGGEGGWFSVGYVPRARRWDTGAGAANLLDGYVGTAWFLAALHQVDPDGGHDGLAREALRPLTERLHEYEAMFRLRRDRDLGAGTGLGSLLYALPRLAHWLNDDRLADAGRRLARLLDGIAAPAADRCDLLSGAAGVIPGLLAMHGAGDADALGRAAAAGRGIMSVRKIEPTTKLGLWQTAPGRADVGYAQGQAGIASALLRLAAVTGEAALVDAARQSFQFERMLLGADLGRCPEALAGWGIAATGLGLARLPALALGEDAEIRADVEAAVTVVRAHLLEGSDAAHAGAAGRVELLLSAGAALNRPEWVREGQDAARAMVRRARATGGWRTGWEPFTHPGLFAGVSGIGYQLLRAAHPERFPAVLAWEI